MVWWSMLTTTQYGPLYAPALCSLLVINVAFLKPYFATDSGGKSFWVTILVSWEYINEPVYRSWSDWLLNSSVLWDTILATDISHEYWRKYKIPSKQNVFFVCFPPLALTPWKVASPYIHPIDLKNGEQNSEYNLNRKWKWILFLMKYGIGKNLTVDTLV